MFQQSAFFKNFMVVVWDAGTAESGGVHEIDRIKKTKKTNLQVFVYAASLQVNEKQRNHIENRWNRGRDSVETKTKRCQISRK